MMEFFFLWSVSCRDIDAVHQDDDLLISTDPEKFPTLANACCNVAESHRSNRRICLGDLYPEKKEHFILELMH